jgi:hypothetical protein
MCKDISKTKVRFAFLTIMVLFIPVVENLEDPNIGGVSSEL